MAGGIACKDKEHRPYWRVAVRNAHYSAFSGGRRTWSEYSELTCLAEGCISSWRSKGAYVTQTPDLKEGEERA